MGLYSALAYHYPVPVRFAGEDFLKTVPTFGHSAFGRECPEMRDRETSTMRILVVDDHEIVRKGICSLLANESTPDSLRRSH